MRAALLSIILAVLFALPARAQSPATFANPVVYGTSGWSPASVAIGDVNGDGKPDLVVTNSCANTIKCGDISIQDCVDCDGTVAVLLGNGDGTFQTAITYDSGGYGAATVAILDVNGDGKPDIVVANDCVPPTAPSDAPCDGNNPLPGSFGVLLGNGDGTFQAAVAYPSVGNFAEALAVADVNGDGKPDVVLGIQCSSTTCSGHSEVAVFLGNGDGTFRSPMTYDSGGYAVFSIVINDVNNDGHPDIITANDCSTYGCPNVGAVGVLLGNGDGTFHSAVSYPSSGNATSIAVADVNGDGKPDLLVGDACGQGTCSTGVSVDVLLGNGDGTFRTAVNYTSAGFVLAYVAVADVNADGKPDLIVAASCNDNACDNNGTVGFLAGNGDGTFRPALSYDSGGPYANFVAIADVNGDAKSDIVVVNQRTSTTQTDVGAIGVLLNITGTSGPIASLSSNELTLTASTVGSPSAPQSVTLSNLGNVPFAINSIQIAGAGAAAFSQTNTCGSSVAANANCTVTVLYTPASNDASTATLKITDGAPGSPHTVSLTGGAIPIAQVSVSPSSLTFGSTQIGIASTPQRVTVQNIGNTAALTITQITASGDFTATANCSGPILFGTSCIISVGFVPTASGTRSGTLSIVDNASGSPQTIALSGTGDAEPPPNVPVVSTSPSTVTFPSQYVGTSGLPQTVTVTNTGGATLVITAVTPSAADFGVINNCTNQVAPGTSCNIAVFFDPTTGGSRTGTLSITDNATGSPQTVALTGSGEDFSMAATSTPSATISAGQTATYSVALAPTSGFAQNVALSCSGGPAMSTCSVTPSSVSLSGTAAKNVRVAVATSSQGFVSPFAGVNPQQKMSLILLTTVFALVFFLAASASLRTSGRLRWAPALAMLLLASMTMTLTSCGGGSTSGASGTSTPEAGTYTVTVTGNFSAGSANITHATKLTLVVH
jgi:hypothetical protein